MDQPDSSSLGIRYRDDGRGINIQRLRAIAQNLGLLPEADLNDARKVANFIFTDGVSTSKAVTEISGRGMGMGAIQAYIERSGGKINSISNLLPTLIALFCPSNLCSIRL